MLSKSLKRETNTSASAAGNTAAPFSPSGSTAIWLTGLFILLSCLLSQFQYLKQIPLTEISPGLQTKSAISFKLNEWKKQTAKTNILIAGSSLPMCAFYYSDKVKNAKALEKIKEQNVSPLQSYTAADYLSQQLSKKTGLPVTVFNATAAACMMSDAHLILSKMLDTAPDKIILCVGMRDFADNINLPVAATPIFQALFDLPYGSEQDNFSFIVRNARPDAINELILDNCIPLYKIHSEMGLFVDYTTGKLLGRKKTVAANKDKSIAVKLPLKETPPVVASPSVIKLDSLGYEKRYLPANYKQMDLEFKCLERICDICRKNKVELILINMPVSSGHNSLASLNMRRKYLDKLQEISTRYSVKYCNFENNKFLPDSDFLDTVHLAPSGATKFVDFLVRESNIFTESN